MQWLVDSLNNNGYYYSKYYYWIHISAPFLDSHPCQTPSFPPPWVKGLGTSVGLPTVLLFAYLSYHLSWAPWKWRPWLLFLCPQARYNLGTLYKLLSEHSSYTRHEQMRPGLLIVDLVTFLSHDLGWVFIYFQHLICNFRYDFPVIYFQSEFRIGFKNYWCTWKPC